MADDALDLDDDTRQLYLDLFTEITIIEHLVRQRFEPRHLAELNAAEFGVLNHFVRLQKSSEKLEMLAWCFQVEHQAMRATVQALANRRLIEIDWVDGFECAFITESGRATHKVIVADMAPDVLEIMAEFKMEDLQTTVTTLKEMRRTFDNLPDR